MKSTGSILRYTRPLPPIQPTESLNRSQLSSHVLKAIYALLALRSLSTQTKLSVFKTVIGLRYQSLN